MDWFVSGIRLIEEFAIEKELLDALRSSTGFVSRADGEQHAVFDGPSLSSYSAHIKWKLVLLTSWMVLAIRLS